MGHKISAVIFRGHYNAVVAAQYDLRGVPLAPDLSMFLIDHVYVACWEKMLGVHGALPTPAPFDNLVFPSSRVVAELMARVTGCVAPVFALIATDYFGGLGAQAAAVYCGAELDDARITTINHALRRLGVTASHDADEFDTVRLGEHRSMPGDLDKYADLAEALGV